jgi:hypothetical protein
MLKLHPHESLMVAENQFVRLVMEAPMWSCACTEEIGKNTHPVWEEEPIMNQEYPNEHYYEISPEEVIRWFLRGHEINLFRKDEEDGHTIPRTMTLEDISALAERVNQP